MGGKCYEYLQCLQLLAAPCLGYTSFSGCFWQCKQLCARTFALAYFNFHAKIIPALKEKGIRRVISRKDWPHEVKRKVLSELMQETPKQLLHQEIWCASEGFKAFRSKLKRLLV